MKILFSLLAFCLSQIGSTLPLYKLLFLMEKG